MAPTPATTFCPNFANILLRFSFLVSGLLDTKKGLSSAYGRLNNLQQRWALQRDASEAFRGELATNLHLLPVGTCYMPPAHHLPTATRAACHAQVLGNMAYTWWKYVAASRHAAWIDNFAVAFCCVCLSFIRSALSVFPSPGLDIANQICAVARRGCLRVSSVHTSAHIDIPAPECSR